MVCYNCYNVTVYQCNAINSTFFCFLNLIFFRFYCPVTVLQVHYPSNPMQPGPMYFLVPRKCSIFGVHCEGIPRQVNYLTDEAIDCGKGANVVISQLDHFFNNHSFGESEFFFMPTTVAVRIKTMQ